jgi:hypothetical protein
MSGTTVSPTGANPATTATLNPSAAQGGNKTSGHHHRAKGSGEGQKPASTTQGTPSGAEGTTSSQVLDALISSQQNQQKA